MKDHHPDGTPEELWKLDPEPRPWGMGQTRYPDSWLTVAAGTIVRRPGCFMRVDPDTNEDTEEPLLNTNERIHASVRVRLALCGMAMDDREAWTCPSLLKDDSGRKGQPIWRLEKGGEVNSQERISQASGKGGYETYHVQKSDGEWNWALNKNAVVKNGMKKSIRPNMNVLPEEPMVGFWERCLLAMLKGTIDVWRLAEDSTSSTEITTRFTK